MSKPTIFLVLTAAIVMDGEIVPAGETIEVTEKEAKNLMHRGKAVLAEPDSQQGAPSVTDFNSLTVEALRKLADDAGIENYRDLRKADLVAALELHAEGAE